jgi:hypothetical protein
MEKAENLRKVVFGDKESKEGAEKIERYGKKPV